MKKTYQMANGLHFLIFKPSFSYLISLLKDDIFKKQEGDLKNLRGTVN